MAVKFAIRNYSRTGNNVSFTIVALNADGSIDTGFTGTFTFGSTNLVTGPGFNTFTAGDMGQHVISTSLQDPANNTFLNVNFPGNSNGASLAIAAPTGVFSTAGLSGDHLLVGGTGDDIFGGNDGDDLILFQDGGVDSASGNGGNDGFYFGGAYTSADGVDGGAGNSDSLGLQGNYSGGVTLGSLLGVEIVALLPGNDTRFGDTAGNSYDYVITANGSTVASFNKLTIQANALRAGEDFRFNGQGTSIDYVIYGGLGTDNLTGGSGNDGFFFGQGRFSAGDTVDGGTGTLDQLGLQGNFSIDFTQAGFAGAISNIDYLVLLSGADTRFGAGGPEYDYSITMDDGNVAAGQTLIVSANNLGMEESLAINGSDETDGRFVMYGGRGNDVLTGGSGNDIIWGGGRGDTLTGGAGNDIFAYLNVTDSNSTERDGIQDFNAGDRIDLSRIDANTNVGGNQDFTFVGSSAFSSTAGELRFENISLGGPIWIIQGDVNGDGVSDLEIVLVISPPDPITVSDFIGVNAQGQGAEPVKFGLVGGLNPLVMDLAADHKSNWSVESRVEHLDLAVIPTTDLLA